MTSLVVRECAIYAYTSRNEFDLWKWYIQFTAYEQVFISIKNLIFIQILSWYLDEQQGRKKIYLTLKLVLKIICLYELPPLHFSKVDVGLEWCWLNQVGNKNTASTEGNSSRIVREQHEKQHYICNLCFALHVVR